MRTFCLLTTLPNHQTHTPLVRRVKCWCDRWIYALGKLSGSVHSFVKQPGLWQNPHGLGRLPPILTSRLLLLSPRLPIVAPVSFCVQGRISEFKTAASDAGPLCSSFVEPYRHGGEGSLRTHQGTASRIMWDCAHSLYVADHKSSCG